MATAAVEVHFQVGFTGQALRTAYLFENRDAATAVFDQLNAATTAYHNRANDRERIVTFECLTGRSAVDVSLIAALGVEDPLGDARAAVDEWHKGVGEIRALANPKAEQVPA